MRKVLYLLDLMRIRDRMIWTFFLDNMNRNINQIIKELADDYMCKLKKQVSVRMSEMKNDDTSHWLVYRVLGVSDDEGKLIDEYQNKGRFLYKYAGSFLEEAAMLCFKYKFPKASKFMIPNKDGVRPKNYEIDCLVGKIAYEIKWRDATTDGDHITKEHNRVKSIREAGYEPYRIMFYYPLREQAIKIQKTLETLYKGIGGKYIYGDAAWGYIKEVTGVDLLGVLQTIAKERENVVQ